VRGQGAGGVKGVKGVESGVKSWVGSRGRGQGGKIRVGSRGRGQGVEGGVKTQGGSQGEGGADQCARGSAHRLHLHRRALPALLTPQVRHAVQPDLVGRTCVYRELGPGRHCSPRQSNTF